MHHVLYGFAEGFRHRHTLSALLSSSQPGLATHAIDPTDLARRGASILALDFDGVLAPHGRMEPLPAAAEWLDRCCRNFGEDKIFILSNKPARERISWFQARHPGIRFITGVRKKPFPDGLQSVIARAGVTPGEVMLLDDRLLTGGLAACLAGTKVTYITAPYVTIASNPLPELFFMGLRAVERLIVRFCH